MRTHLIVLAVGSGSTSRITVRRSHSTIAGGVIVQSIWQQLLDGYRCTTETERSPFDRRAFDLGEGEAELRCVRCMLNEGINIVSRH